MHFRFKGEEEEEEGGVVALARLVEDLWIRYVWVVRDASRGGGYVEMNVGFRYYDRHKDHREGQL